VGHDTLVTDDRSLRELERAAPTSTSDRLRYARALERLGRRDEALDALLPAREDPEIETALHPPPRPFQPIGLVVARDVAYVPATDRITAFDLTSGAVIFSVTPRSGVDIDTLALAHRALFGRLADGSIFRIDERGPRATSSRAPRRRRG
jgi:hypothetical protein